MGTKTISITDEAYKILKNKKKGSESFSEAIVRLSGKTSLISCLGLLTKKEGRSLANAIKEGSRVRNKHRKRRINL